MAWRLQARNRVCAGRWDNLWLRIATMANFKPRPCLQTARVATSCDACGVEVGSEALRCHLVEERARIAFYCPSCCYICQKAKTGTPKGQTRGGKQLTDSDADAFENGRACCVKQAAV